MSRYRAVDTHIDTTLDIGMAKDTFIRWSGGGNCVFLRAYLHGAMSATVIGELQRCAVLADHVRDATSSGGNPFACHFACLRVLAV